jgi:hypothetical protein
MPVATEAQEAFTELRKVGQLTGDIDVAALKLVLDKHFMPPGSDLEAPIYTLSRSSLRGFTGDHRACMQDLEWDPAGAELAESIPDEATRALALRIHQLWPHLIRVRPLYCIQF